MSDGSGPNLSAETIKYLAENNKKVVMKMGEQMLMEISVEDNK